MDHILAHQVTNRKSVAVWRSALVYSHMSKSEMSTFSDPTNAPLDYRSPLPLPQCNRAGAQGSNLVDP